MKKLNSVDWIAIILLVVGGLNWGLVGAFNVDLVEAIFGKMTTLSRIIYIIVGLCSLYVLWISFRLVKSETEQD
jgi:uncharacterized membrane protein YuzA (DUF378 family)